MAFDSVEVGIETDDLDLTKGRKETEGRKRGKTIRDSKRERAKESFA